LEVNLFLHNKSLAAFFENAASIMKNKFIRGSQAMQKKEMKAISGGAAGAFKLYMCAVSPDGYTPGNVCLSDSSARPATMCKICYGVSYAEFIGYTSYCPSVCVL
jgi:hypothetical protein